MYRTYYCSLFNEKVGFCCMAREEQNTSRCNFTKMDRHCKKVAYWPSDVLRAERYDLSPSLHSKQFRLIKCKCEDGKSFNIHSMS